MRTDSGTIRNVVGSMRFELAVVVGAGWSRLGRPRAAAAQERRVERLARRAASWSGWWEGDITLNGVWERVRWDG